MQKPSHTRRHTHTNQDKPDIHRIGTKLIAETQIINPPQDYLKGIKENLMKIDLVTYLPTTINQEHAVPTDKQTSEEYDQK